MRRMSAACDIEAVRRNRCFSALHPQNRRQEHGGGRKEPERRFEILAVRQSRNQCPHHIDRWQGKEGGVGHDMRVDFCACRSEPLFQTLAIDVRFHQSVEQQRRDAFIGAVRNEVVERNAADDQPPGRTVDIRKPGLRGNHIFQTVFHRHFSFTEKKIGPRLIDVNLDEIDQYEAQCPG